METRAIVARNLKRLREARRLSQEALAHDAGVNRSYVSDLERGKSSATTDRLDLLAKILGVTTCQLVDEEFEP